MHVVDFTTFYPPHVGGVEAYAAALHTEWLRRPGWRVTVHDDGSLICDRLETTR